MRLQRKSNKKKREVIMAVSNKRNTVYTAVGFSADARNRAIQGMALVGQAHSLAKWLEILGEPDYTGWRESYIVDIIYQHWHLRLEKGRR